MSPADNCLHILTRNKGTNMRYNMRIRAHIETALTLTLVQGQIHQAGDLGEPLKAKESAVHQFYFLNR